jgi:hypothetical protein
LIYPLEIIQNTLSLDVRQGLDGGFDAGQQFDGDRIPIEGLCVRNARKRRRTKPAYLPVQQSIRMETVSSQGR